MRLHLQTLLQAHYHLAAYERSPPPGPALAAPGVGLWLLCQVRCVGWEPNARAIQADGEPLLPELPGNVRWRRPRAPTEDGAPVHFIGMEQLLGGTLEERLEEAASSESGALSPDEQLLAAADLTGALMALHDDMRVAHADIK